MTIIRYTVDFKDPFGQLIFSLTYHVPEDADPFAGLLLGNDGARFPLASDSPATYYVDIQKR